MKRIACICLLLICWIGQAVAQVPDKEIIEMVQTARKQGMNQQQIAAMLLQKGVTKEQLMQLKETYENGTLNLKQKEVLPENRLRQIPVKEERKTTDRRYLKEDEMTGASLFEGNKETIAFIDSVGYEMGVPRPEKKTEQKTVFGRDIFNNEMLTFEPLLNMATPDNYLLGPGDEVIIDIWGTSEASLRQIISPDGNILVDGIGPLHLSGLTVKEANARVRNEFGKIYSGIHSGNAFVRLTLGQIRSIQVNVMGDVTAPGTYTLPSLASAFHALYSAGGVNPIGSLRSMKIYRNGKEVGDIDVYGYILKGKTDSDIVLQDGDVLVVAPYANLVEITGKVKRPMIYELKNPETVSDLLLYTGGFTGDAYKKSIRVIRKSGREHQIYNVDENDFSAFPLMDGDQVSVDSVLPRFENKVEIRGAVYREGLYAIGKDIMTLRQLVDKAEGVRGDAFLNRAVLYREKPDLTLQVQAVDLAGLLAGKTEDIPLAKNDVLYIPSVFDLQEDYTLIVKGAVRNPGTYKYVDNMTLEDLIIQGGGLLESASTVKIDVARRIKDPKSTTIGERRAETYTFTLKDGFLTGGQPGFILQPFDEVYVRQSPGYQIQQNVLVEGEVMFGGEYTLAKKGERLSGLIARAGGLTPDAYPEGARLMRRSTPEEKQLVQQTLLKLAQQQTGGDTIDVAQMTLGDYYPVGIELKEALENPNSDYDIVLREGDRLIVPEYSGTVRISGAVMYPNTVSYKPSMKTPYYISQAGGYAQKARKSRAFVIYMNRTVAVARGGKLDIKPGCEIIVPMKQPRKGLGLAEIMSLASSTTSMAAMVTSIINTTK